MPVILDGAQGAGAVPVDVQALGCVAYAAAGQKWLCGADGTGMLYLDPEFGERVRTIAPDLRLVRGRLARPGVDRCAPAGGASTRRSRARRSRSRSPRWRCWSRPTWTRRWSARPTWPTRSRAALAEAGHTVAPRGRSTLVAFEYPEPAEARERLAEAGRRRARPARPPVPARLGRRLERRVRPRAPARRAVKSVCVYCGSSTGSDPVYPRPRSSSRRRSRRAACGSSTAAPTSA